MPHISYHVNDGKSLAMVPDESVNFAFSFDSLVHADLDVLRAYLVELRNKLSPDGVAFLHHSNIGAYARRWAVQNHLPRNLGGLSELFGSLVTRMTGTSA